MIERNIPHTSTAHWQLQSHLRTPGLLIHISDFRKFSHVLQVDIVFDSSDELFYRSALANSSLPHTLQHNMVRIFNYSNKLTSRSFIRLNEWIYTRLTTMSKAGKSFGLHVLVRLTVIKCLILSYVNLVTRSKLWTALRQSSTWPAHHTLELQIN